MHITCGSTARLYCSNMWASQTAALVTICIIIGCISQPTSARVLSEMASDTLPEGAVAGGALSSDNDQDQAPQNAGAEGAPPAMVTARQAAPTPVYFPTRVYWDPNEGKLDQVKDYVADVMIGDIDIAKADPVIAATGAAAHAGVRLGYGTGTQFDYEAPTSSLTVGPGAKALATAVARFNGLGSAKALGRGTALSSLGYTRNAYGGNSATFGTTDRLTGSASAGLYLDRTSGNDNTALLAQTPPRLGIFGR